MIAIRAMVRNGRIETDDPLDLPDGTGLLVYPAEERPDPEDAFGDSPEGLAAWLQAFDARQPLVLSDEDRAEIEKARADQRAWELAHFEERAEKLRKMWE
jgi:hypothetical protein